MATLSIEMKSALLGLLTSKELHALAARLGIAVRDMSAEGDLVNAITGMGVTLHRILPVLSRARRDDVCRALGIEGRRREGCVIAEVGGHR